MSYDNRLATCIREVLKEHQRDGLSMIGNVDKLVASLVHAVETWFTEEKLAEDKLVGKKTA